MHFVRRLANCNTGCFKIKQTLSFPFCSGVASKGETNAVLEDWEYCRMIGGELKSNNINQALSFVFQSYFNGKILDIQIYNSVFEKINELALPLSYAEILYEIYRENFPPNTLIHEWMSKLTYSSNQKFIEKLKLDYQAIGQPYPVRTLRNIKKQSKKQQKSEKGEHPDIKEENSSTKRSTRNRKASSQPLNINQIPKIELDNYESINKLSESMSNEDLIRLKYANDIKEVLEGLNLGIGNYSKIVFQDVEVIMNNPHEAMNNMHEDHNEYEYDEQNESEDDYYGLDINKIKIGKIEFFNEPNDKQNS